MLVERRDTRELERSFGGPLLRPGDPGYDDARAIHNGLIDKRPALIARCTSASDIAAAVQFARKAGLEIAVRGGGHNVAGRAVCEGGVMIDLSLMKRMTTDPRSRVARAEPGLTWGEYNQVTQAQGLASTGGVISTTGIAGLTLGGGLGWLMGRHGLAIDNLVAAEVVTASGEVLPASESENRDLFWALRGGGGNFGIVSSFEFQLHPVGPMVVSGVAAHPLAQAREVLRFARDFTERAPDDLTVHLGLLFAPDGSGTPIAGMVVCHAGPVGAAAEEVRPIKEFGSPVMDTIGPQTYEATNMMLDAGFPKGALNYWKSAFLADLSDDAIDAVVARFAGCPSTMSAIVFEYLHGAATRVPVGATAFPQREPGWSMLILSQWSDAADSERNAAWTRETYDAMLAFTGKRQYVNYLSDDHPPESMSDVYGPNYERLRQVKRKYDPENVFHLNQNIRP